jgi:hypothetical protein
VWQTIAAMFGAERRDREAVERNAQRGMGAEPEDGWATPEVEGEPSQDVERVDLDAENPEPTRDEDGRG